VLRTVPSTTNTELELYVRTYYSLLRSSEPFRIRSLEDSYAGTRASLHPLADAPQADVAAFTYAIARLPSCICRTETVFLAQSDEVFLRRGGLDVAAWPRVLAAARRRKMHFDGDGRLACFISSVSDIDDIIPLLTAFQIEWNKLHERFHGSSTAEKLLADEDPLLDDELLSTIRTKLELSDEDFARLSKAWGEDLPLFLRSLALRRMDLKLNLLAGSLADYRQAVQAWWRGVVTASGFESLADRHVYFVSSNPHSLPNLISGYPSRIEEQLVAFLDEHNPENLRAEWRAIQEEGDIGKRRNFLYYMQRYYISQDEARWKTKLEAMVERGIQSIHRPRYLDVGAQVIELAKLDPTGFDPRVLVPGVEKLAASDALIINVDYPLGMAAYHLFSQITANVPGILGIYIMGKAASLNGRVGDVMLPNVVFDDHSHNTYLFKNCFTAADVAPYLSHGTVFDNQKAVTVRGTLLQNHDFMDVFYREGYTDIEMEAGPYLSAIYEDIYPRRYPVDEIVTLFINAPYDIGVLHYASDTPYSRRQSLLSKSLSYFGVDATYATTVAITRRILAAEVRRLEARGR